MSEAAHTLRALLGLSTLDAATLDAAELAFTSLIPTARHGELYGAHFPDEHRAILALGQGEAQLSACTCHDAPWCAHRLALALWIGRASPAALRALPERPPLPGMSLAVLEAWAARHEVSAALDKPGLSWTRASARAALRSVAESREVRHMDARVAFAVCDALEQAAQAHEAQRAYADQREALRSAPPEDPALAALWLRLHTERATYAGLSDYLGAPGELSLDPYQRSETERARLNLVLHERTIRLDLSREPALWIGASGESERKAVLDGLIDALVEPERAPSLAAALSACAEVEPWREALRTLQASLPAPEAKPGKPGRLGWRLTRTDAGQAEVTPIWLTERATGTLAAARFKDQTEQLSRLDRGRLRLYQSAKAGWGERAHLTELLDRLVDAQDLFDPELRPVRIRRSTLRASLATDETALTLSWSFGETPLPRAVARQLAAAAGPEDTAYWPPGYTLYLLALPDGGKRALDALLALPERLPSHAAAPLLDAINPHLPRLPLRLEGELAGQPEPPDETPELRLSTDPYAGLVARLYLRPLPEGPLVEPGEGQEQLWALRDGRRIVVTRALHGELDRALAVVRAAGWPANTGPLAQLDSADAAGALLQGLAAAGTAVRLTWDGRPMTHHTARAANLSLRGLMEQHLTKLDGKLVLDDLEVPLTAILEALREGQRWIQVDQQHVIRLEDTVRRRLTRLAAATWSDRAGMTVGPVFSPLMLSELESDGAQLSFSDTLRARLARVDEAKDLHPDVPDVPNATIRPYQVDGFRALARLAHWSPGAVLADEMGLGKTLQALLLLMHRQAMGPALVVAPASVVDTWAREAARFAPSLSVVTSRGAGRHAAHSALGPGTVLLTSWDLLVRDAEALHPTRFTTLVLDEAHAIKNPGTRRSKAVKLIQAEFTLALTGTPLENRLDELWALLSRVVPGLLGSAARFRQLYARPAAKEVDTERRSNLAELVRPFLLRRRKVDVAADLPPRTERTERIHLDPRERAYYEATRVALKDGLEGVGEDHGRIHVLAGLTRLRQLACAPRLVHPAAPERSSKLDRLRDLAGEIAQSGNSVLVFSQFTSLLDLAAPQLQRDGLRVLRLDGSTPVASRQALVDRFQAGEADVFLLSLKAGGTGLTLTRASVVILLDPWWNPAVEAQAGDRAHRIGQTQSVTIIRLIAADTLEEAVHLLQDAKRTLVEGLLDEAAPDTSLDAASLAALLDTSPLVPEE